MQFELVHFYLSLNIVNIYNYTLFEISLQWLLRRFSGKFSGMKRYPNRSLNRSLLQSSLPA